ncbi:MAG: response regulator transcription factor [Syntrophomonadaceae bacterium]|nr:response regulator transcription factor [Syntrophomonadaceae bacterium]
MRILIVEDEKRLAGTLADILNAHKYLTDISYDGESGLYNALSGIYDAIILDVMLPKLNGFEVVKRLRREGNHTPVLMLTSKTEVADKVTGLDSGSDYYLTKPFETDELLACVRSLVRRQGEILPDEIGYRGVILSLSTCTLRCEERSVSLSSREFEIMRLLMVNGENIISKETLLLKVWGYESEADDNYVEVYISFLRKKLAHIRAGVTIETVRKVGYHLGIRD